MLRNFQIWLSAFIARSIFLLLRYTLRLKHVNPPQIAGRCVFAHWHGDELVLVGAFAYRNLGILSSASRDGEIMARVLKGLGYRVVRGSSSRRAVSGFLSLVDLMEEPDSAAAVAVDGPRGPRHRVKMGVVKLAQLTGATIVPGTCRVSHAIHFRRSWNQAYLPIPFATGEIFYGRPMTISSSASDEEVSEARVQLEKELLDLSRLAQATDAATVHPPQLASTP